MLDAILKCLAVLHKIITKKLKNKQVTPIGLRRRCPEREYYSNQCYRLLYTTSAHNI